MRSALPKALHPVGGRPLVGHVLAAAAALRPAPLVVVVGHAREQVQQALAALCPAAVPVVQAEQRGTGHAVRLALPAVPETVDTVVVLPGDTPLLTGETLLALLDAHRAAGAAATLLTATPADPTGYGRVIRDDAGRVLRLVEQRDASPTELAVGEVGTSVYAFAAGPLRAAVGRLGVDNAQGEEYLTDVIADLVAAGRPVQAVAAPDPEETLGVNDRVQLAAAGRELNRRTLHALMRSGVSVVDPQTTWVDVDVRVDRDAVLLPGVQLHGATVVGEGARIGPDCTLSDTSVGAGATVVRAHCEGAEIGREASVGPYAYLRPGARLAPRAKVGTYVEVKNAELGEGAKVPHLTYVGDASIGEGSNIGAASVFVNYDGVAKHRTTVGRHARTGSDTMFVAPVAVGDGAYTAAGSVIVHDVPAGALAVARAQQRNIEGWVERARPGTPSAEAAKQARAAGGGRHNEEHPPTDEAEAES